MSDQKPEPKPGWRSWRFDQIAINVNDRVDDPSQAGVERYLGLEHLDSDSLRIRRWGTPDDVEATKLRFRSGDVIFGRRRAYQRKLAVADFEGICSAHAMVLRARSEVILPEFLPFFMQSDTFMERAKSISVGSLSPTINWKTLADQTFAIPPLEEQGEILRLLVCVEEALQTNETLLVTLGGVLAALSERYSTAFGAGLDDSGTVRAAEMPRGWRVVPISELCFGQGAGLTLGPFGSDLIAADYSHSQGVPVVFVADVTRAGFCYTSNKFVTVQKARDLAAHEAAPGDVLVTKMGWPPGEACVVPLGSAVSIITADIVRARVARALVLPEYLAMVINSNWGQHQIVRIAPGTTRPKFTLRDFEQIQVATPPMRVQEEACQQVLDIRSQLNECGARLQSLKALRRATAEKLLEGRHVQ